MDKPNELSEMPAQDDVLRYIQDYKADPANDGNSPTYREIADGTGRSLSAIYGVCRRLQKRGLLLVNERGKLVLPGGKYEPPDDA
jgi:hypothetical protein